MADETVRKVWLLWWTGWDSAPPLVKECAASWIEQNPTWTVQLLDRRTVYRHINITLPPAQWAWMKRKEQPAASDLVRLALMAQRGGVYADATEFCLQPLDAWVHRMLRRSTGFVGSREWDASKNRLLEASNWMAAARPGHPVAARVARVRARVLARAAVGPAVRGAVAAAAVGLRVPLLLDG